MATSDYVFEPNNFRGLFEHWEEEIGHEHNGVDYNGWAFFDAERNLLDTWISDIEDEWVGTDDGSQAGNPGGATRLLDAHARGVGATDIICVHSHNGVGEGPCPDLPLFLGGVTGDLRLWAMDNDLPPINLRGCLIIHNGELDGYMAVAETKPGRVSPGTPLTDEMLGLARSLQPILRGRTQPLFDAAIDAAILEAIEDYIAAIEAGKVPDPTLISNAIAMVEDGDFDLGGRGRRALPRIDPLDALKLPPIVINKEMLN